MFHKTKTVLFVLAACCFAAAAGGAGAKTEVKFGTLAPDGSTWMKIMRQFAKEMEKQSHGEVTFKIYPQTKGDENTILKFLQAKKLSAAGFTGTGLGAIYPGVRVFEAPQLFRNYQEVDYVMEKMWPEMQKSFGEKGYILLGRGEAGFVNVWSNKPIKSQADFSGVRLWAWEGDPLSKAMVETFGIVPIYLSLPDVLTALQTNRIDACYAPPLAAMALQWHTKVKYYTDLPLANAIGAFIITKDAYGQMTPEQQQMLVKLGWVAGKKLVEQTRKDNAAAYEAIKKQGIQAVPVPPDQLKIMEELSAKVREKLVGKLYSRELLDKVQGLLKEYRASH